jgi:hypothetical protein
MYNVGDLVIRTDPQFATGSIAEVTDISNTIIHIRYVEVHNHPYRVKVGHEDVWAKNRCQLYQKREPDWEV